MHTFAALLLVLPAHWPCRPTFCAQGTFASPFESLGAQQSAAVAATAPLAGDSSAGAPIRIQTEADLLPATPEPADSQARLSSGALAAATAGAAAQHLQQLLQQQQDAIGGHVSKVREGLSSLVGRAAAGKKAPEQPQLPGQQQHPPPGAITTGDAVRSLHVALEVVDGAVKLQLLPAAAAAPDAGRAGAAASSSGGAVTAAATLTAAAMDGTFTAAAMTAATAAALGQGLAAVKGLSINVRRDRGSAGGGGDQLSSSAGAVPASTGSTPQATATATAAQSTPPATAATGAAAKARGAAGWLGARLGLASRGTSEQEGAAHGTAAAAGVGVGVACPRVLEVRLLVSAGDGAQVARPVQLQLLPVAGGAHSERTSVSGGGAATGGAAVWRPLQGLLGRRQAGAAAAAATPAEASGEDEDMFSSLNRLRVSDPGASAPASKAAAQAAEHAAAAAAMQQQGEALVASLAAAAAGVTAQAAAGKHCMGDESASLLALCELCEDVFSHGLLQPQPPGGGWGAPLVGWLQARRPNAFRVLQALEHGGKHAPRLLLGAEGIARMKAARAASDADCLRMWVRSSLNEQLLGSRLDMLASADPSLLAPHYAPQALLLQRAPLGTVVAAARQLDAFKFLLVVETSDGGAGAAAGAQQQQQQQPAAAVAAVSEFRWPGAAATPSDVPAAAAAAVAAGGAAGLFGRRRRVANIQEAAPLPAIITGAGGGFGGGVLSPAHSSAALSPLSVVDDLAGAEWWDPAAAVLCSGSEGSSSSLTGAREAMSGRAGSCEAAAQMEARLQRTLSDGGLRGVYVWVGGCQSLCACACV